MFHGSVLLFESNSVADWTASYAVLWRSIQLKQLGRFASTEHTESHTFDLDSEKDADMGWAGAGSAVSVGEHRTQQLN